MTSLNNNNKNEDSQSSLTTFIGGLQTKPDDIVSKSLELLAKAEPLEHCLRYGYSTLFFLGSSFGVCKFLLILLL